MVRLLTVTLALALLGGCTLAQVAPVRVSIPFEECTPVDPLAQEQAAIPCFRALLTAENEVTLQWRVTNSLPQVYIYSDFGGSDIGFQPAVCPESQNTCSTSLKFKTGGFHRWLLKVEHPDGAQTHIAASVDVPGPFPLMSVYFEPFVDMLYPTDRLVTWAVDTRNAECQETIENAWIERKDSAYREYSQRYLRCGAGARFTIPIQQLSEPGKFNYRIRDCHYPVGSDTKFCSPTVLVGVHIGADRFLDPTPLYADSGKDMTLSFTSQSGDVRRLYSPTLIPPETGQDFIETSDSNVTIDGHLLTPGTHTVELASCISDTDTAPGTCSPRTRLEILVDAPVHWDLYRDYREDFLPGTGHAVLGAGGPLDITYDASGGIWLINEFSTSIEFLSPSGSVESFTIPLARKSVQDGSSFKRVTPFAIAMGEGEAPTVKTSLGERTTLVGSKIWFTQGGGMMDTTTTIPNHSRIVSFDPALTDSLATPFDDRLCVYNVPTDDAMGFGNNQVIGLTGARNRIWIGEMRSAFGDDKPSAISSFIPDPASCDNLLNFADTEAVANQKLQYCGPNQTPEQDGCMEKILLEPFGVRAVHLATDPVDDSIWFTDGGGAYLGNLNPDRKTVVKLYPLPNNHADLGPLGGLPWALRVDKEAVYFGEYGPRHLLRFDKATSTFDEVEVPVMTSEVALHSIDIDHAAGRLWFTIANEKAVPQDKLASTIGYIDLASWRQHLANKDEAIQGVIYKNLDTIPALPEFPDRHQSFRGIAVDPRTGKIALATHQRKQITELIPNAAFWP